MIYRILSACAGLGYGYEESSFNEATKMKLNLIAADAGSMDPGPYYLGKGVSYMQRSQLKQDFSLMLKAALQQQCPVMIGSCGLAGDRPHLELMIDIVKEICEEQRVKNLKIAIIDAHIDNRLVLEQIHELKALGQMPSITEEMIQESVIVGQMGIAPFIKALDEGAQVILAGRACDVAIFAADPIRCGIDPGLAYQVGHILECGAIACDPGSGSDCLIAEFRDDKSVIFISPNQERRTTIQSIAAHNFYEEDHPLLQTYPEGKLSFQETEYFQKTPSIAGIRNGIFVHRPLSVKLEGSQKIGERVISLFFCKNIDEIPGKYFVYGRNGVEKDPVTEKESEIGILIRVISHDENISKTALTLLKGYLMHLGYPGRFSTAGNLAFPISPSEVNYKDEKDRYVSLVFAGSRDPLFQEKIEFIQDSVLSLFKRNYSDLWNQCKGDIIIGDKIHPLLYLETVAKTRSESESIHKYELKSLEGFLDQDRPSFCNISVGEAFIWTLYHLISNEKVIKEHFFPITLYNCNGKEWEPLSEVRASYKPIGITDYLGDLEESQVGVIQKVLHSTPPRHFKALKDIAKIIRSKNAGVNRITFDIFFKTAEDYELAIHSNAFLKEEISKTLRIPMERVIGSFRADNCNAIKISAFRPLISGSPGDRDVFGAQQHVKLLSINIPVY